MKSRLLLAMAFTVAFPAVALTQSGTWRCNVYSNGTSVYTSTHASFATCTAACQGVATHLTLQTGKSHRAVCTRAGNGGLPSGKKRR